MKKLLGFLLFLIILALVIWGGATWFIGQETEKQLRQQIESSNAANQGLAKMELVEYKKTSFLGAQATTKITTGVPFIDDILADASIITEIKHGPAILTDSGVEFAASKWTSHIDLDSLDEEVMGYITELFGDKNPLLAETLIGFDEKAHYTLTMPALSQEGAANFEIDGLTITGTQSLQDKTGLATLTIGEMHLQDQTLEAIIPSITANLDIKGFIGSQILGSSTILAPAIKLKPASGGEIRFDLSAETNTQQKDDEVNGTMTLIANNVTEPSNTIKLVNYDINYQGLSAAGLNELSNIEAELNNLQSQLLWNMDATKNPEGQDKMMAIIEKMQQTTQQMIKVLFDKVLIATKSQINQSLKLSGDKGNSTLDTEFVYTGNKDKQPVDVDKMMLGDLSGALNIIAGTINIDIDKSMLPPEISMIVGMGVAQGIAKDENDKFSLHTSLTDGEITLNGETMSMEELIAKFSPKAPADISNPNSSLPLPADIEKRIQEEGLTPEILQDLAESDDVDPEVLKQLEELNRLMESVDAAPSELPAEVTGGAESTDLPVEGVVEQQ